MGSSSRLTISRIAAPIMVLGPGRRLAIWVQGCTIGCQDCASVDTWPADGGTTVAVCDLVTEVAERLDRNNLDGLTITGGEPFQQAEAAVNLLSLLRAAGALDHRDVLVFTGFANARARTISPQLWDEADALVTGPYISSRSSGGWLLASDNQRLVCRTALARERFTPAIRPSIQMSAQESRLSITGLPQAGDLDRFRELMAARGISFGGVSWQR